MLDLTTMTNKNTLYEIKMPDGEILTLKLPTQGLLMKLMDIQNIDKKDPLAALNGITSVLTEIFNLNTQGKVYTEDQIQQMLDLKTMMLVIKDYFNTTAKTLGE